MFSTVVFFSYQRNVVPVSVRLAMVPLTKGSSYSPSFTSRELQLTLINFINKFITKRMPLPWKQQIFKVTHFCLFYTFGVESQLSFETELLRVAMCSLIGSLSEKAHHLKTTYNLRTLPVTWRFTAWHCVKVKNDNIFLISLPTVIQASKSS